MRTEPWGRAMASPPILESLKASTLSVSSYLTLGGGWAGAEGAADPAGLDPEAVVGWPPLKPGKNKHDVDNLIAHWFV